MTDATLTAAGAAEIAGRSLWDDARRRFMRNKAAVGSGVVLAVIAVACFAAPWLGLRAPDDINWDMVSAPPDWSQGYLFGTDQNGRDLFVRTLYGGQVSLMVGAVASLVSLVIGVAWGATAGFVGGRRNQDVDPRSDDDANAAGRELKKPELATQPGRQIGAVITAHAAETFTSDHPK